MDSCASVLVALSTAHADEMAEPVYAKPPVFNPLPTGSVLAKGLQRDWYQQALDGPKTPVAATNAPHTKLTLLPFGATAFRISTFAVDDVK